MSLDESGGPVGPIFQHPLAYLLGLEGASLLRAFAGEHDEAFTCARIDEIRGLLDGAGRLGDGAVVAPLTAADAYDGWATSYDGPNSIFDLEQPTIRPLLDALAPGDAIDAACGTGRHTGYLADRGHRVRGFDASPGMLAVARDKLPDVTFARADVRDLPVADASADLVVNALALAHVEDLDPVFAEVRRVLRPGGHFVVSDTRTQFLGSVLYPMVKETNDGRVGYIPTWRHDTGQHLRAALSHGFEILACEEVVRPPLDVDEWEPELPEPGEPFDFWGLMPLVPEAARAAYLGTVAVVVWHFRLR